MTPGAPDDRFVSDVLARTSGEVCAGARLRLAGHIDDPPDPTGRALLDEHLRHCPGCRAVADMLASLRAKLPALAEGDPGPGFAGRVLAATSQRARELRWYDGWLERWQTVSGRPRFAWEAAYGLTLLFVLLVGDPVRAWDRTAGRLERWTLPAFELRLPEAPAALARADGRGWPRLDTVRDWLDARAREWDGTRRAPETAPWTRAWTTLTEAASHWGRRALDWLDELVATFRPAHTEPADAPVRSKDRTETTP